MVALVEMAYMLLYLCVWLWLWVQILYFVYNATIYVSKLSNGGLYIFVFFGSCFSVVLAN